ncbi:MAG: DUF3817 domain-containing protein [Sulfurovum sp.]|nr:DUF3817 domain-containing protein [Sulfurovum sp.]
MSEFIRFKIINKIEGYSYLILLFIAMPLKYFAGFPIATKVAGMAHGVLFIAFVYQLFRAHKESGFTLKESTRYFILSLLPFGSFYTDKELNQKIEANKILIS